MRLLARFLVYSAFVALGLSTSCGGGGSNGNSPIPTAPSITSFTAAPPTITEGSSAVLTAIFSHGTGVITPGNIAVTSGTAIHVTPAATTLYTLAVTNSAGAAITQIVAVNLVPPPKMPIISAPANVNRGSTGLVASVPSQLGCSYRWTISNGTISSGSTSSQMIFSVDNPGTTHLYCDVTNAAGTDVQSQFIVNVAPIPLLPIIDAPAFVSAGAKGLTASVAPQAGCSYVWTIANATITGDWTTNQISFTAGASGFIQLGCTVTNQAGTASPLGAAMLTIVQMPVITNFTNSLLTIKPGQHSTLTWSVTGAATVSIDQGVGTVTGTSVEVTPASTTVYTLTATNEIGGSATASVTLCVTTTGLSVYAAGHASGAPGYWQNGNWVGLPVPSAAKNGCSVSSLAVSGNEIYVGGWYSYTQRNGHPYSAPGYWRNGTWVSLPVPLDAENGGCVSSLVIAGRDLYAGGNYANRAYWTPNYWLNGTLIPLPLQPGGPDISVSALAVAGSNVFAAGSGTYLPGYWLNGTWLSLPVSSGTGGSVSSLLLVGSEVYAAGQISGNTEYPVPGYWLNGTWVSLPVPLGAQSSVRSIVVVGSDVYVGGVIRDNTGNLVPGYWLNGTWVSLQVPSGARGAVSSLFVVGSDVYAGGAISGDTTIPVPGYWLNGAWVSLPLPSAATNGGQVWRLVVQ